MEVESKRRRFKIDPVIDTATPPSSTPRLPNDYRPLVNVIYRLLKPARIPWATPAHLRSALASLRSPRRWLSEYTVLCFFFVS
jgi:hypothetical protein